MFNPFRRVPPLDEYEPFAGLPVRRLAMGPAGAAVAVHLAGLLDGGRLPVVCLPSYHRNMADYAAFVRQFHALADSDWPLVLIDLRGRGRSTYRRRMADYTTLGDAADVAVVCDALGIERAVFIGQGHGGQTLMALAGQRADLLAGAVLIDAGPITDTPGVVRMRDNLIHMGSMRRETEFRAVSRQIYGLAHPGATDAELDAIAARTHMRTGRGRARPLFDTKLIDRLKGLAVDDVFEPQWKLFHALGRAELMLVRTQLTDMLQRATFERMGELRSDAVQFVIPGEGAPPSLAGENEVGAIADFARQVTERVRPQPVVAG